MNCNNKNIRILYVDDSATIRDMVESTLFELGYVNITGAIDGKDAIEVIEQNEDDDFDFIITDINMPNMDGFEFILYLRNGFDYASTPIMVLTTEYSNAMKQKGKNVGATSWIVKPFNKELLHRAICDTIKKVEEE